MIDIRIAKLRFLLDEIQLGLHLATQAPDGFAARTLARHVLIRAHDFGQHAGRLHKPIKDAGHDTRAFNQAKNTYDGLFREFFKLGRDRLAAHVQDIDFAKRVDLWNAIQLPGLSVFADEALNIYNGLAPFGLPGYTAYADPPEKGSQALRDALGIVARSFAAREGVYVGSDPLALARPNTVATLGTSTLQERAGQLALIRRWIDFQADLLVRLGAFPATIRILKARLVTDLVSFCDCLVTRPVPPGAPQEMDGLDRLLAAEQEPVATIEDVVANTRFAERLDAFRTVRNHVGGHLDGDDARPLSVLLAELNDCDTTRLLTFYGLVRDTFQRMCTEVLFLRLYAADQQPLAGALGTARPGGPSFEGEAPQEAPLPVLPPINDEEAYHRHLRLWLDGDPAHQHRAKEFFRPALDSSTVAEHLTEEVTFRGGTRFERAQYRRAHAFLADTLAGDLSQADFLGVVTLMIACRSADAYPLSEVLIRVGPSAHPTSQSRICRTLGELASIPHAAVDRFLRDLLRAREWDLRAEASLALYKRFIHSEAFDRASKRGQPRDHGAFVAELTSGKTEHERLIDLLTFASVLVGPRYGALHQHFRADHTALLTEIEALATPLLADAEQQAALRNLLTRHHYLGVALLLVGISDADQLSPLRTALLHAGCTGLIACNGPDGHLADCYLRTNNLDAALDPADALARANPGHVSSQVFLADVLSRIPGQEARAAAVIADIRYLYLVPADLEGVLGELARRIAERARG